MCRPEKIADAVRAAFGKIKNTKTGAVILAAGSSSRMCGIDKQFAEIDGVPVIVKTLLPFEKSEIINEIVVVTRKESVARINDLCEKYGIKKLKTVIEGGETREDSAWIGFCELSDGISFVAIHDGARCLVTEKMISDVAKQAFEFGAAAAAHRSIDTVKRSERGSFVDETLDRDNIWLVQTPQIFGCDLYRAAAYTAKEADFSATDDCSLVERIEYKSIKLVECGSRNMKITTREDLVIAKAVSDAYKEK